MKLSTAINLKERLTKGLDNLISQSEIYKLHSSLIHEKYLDIRDNTNKNCPIWIKYYLDGRYDYWKRNKLYRYDLEFCYVIELNFIWFNIPIVISIHKKSDRYYEKHNITPYELNKYSIESHHYWNNTNKIFF